MHALYTVLLPSVRLHLSGNTLKWNGESGCSIVIGRLSVNVMRRFTWHLSAVSGVALSLVLNDLSWRGSFLVLVFLSKYSRYFSPSSSVSLYIYLPTSCLLPLVYLWCQRSWGTTRLYFKTHWIVHALLTRAPQKLQ